MNTRPVIPFMALVLASSSMLPTACAHTSSSHGSRIYGPYAITLEDLYQGQGTLSIFEAEGQCQGWVVLPGAGAELIRCTAQRNEVTLIIRPLDSSGRDIVVSAKSDGRTLAGSWATEGRRGRFLGRRRGY
jgi:hypothetical protein